MRIAAAALALALAAAGSARAQTRSVVVLSTGAADERGLVAALRVQLEPAARVEEGPSLDPGTLAQRLQAAVDRVAERGATLALWIDPIAPELGGGVVLHVVRGDRARALLEVVRVGTAPGDAATVLHRELALRVAAILDLLETVEDDLAAGIAVPTEARRATIRPVVAAGVTAASGALGPSAGAQLAAGVELAPRGWSLELRALGRAFAETDHPSDAGLVSIQEIDGGIDARLGIGDELAAAVGLELALRRLGAVGIAPWDESGEATRYVPAMRAMVEGTLWALAGVGLRAGVAGEVSFVHQRFSIGGRPAVDLGRFRFCATGELVLRFR